MRRGPHPLPLHIGMALARQGQASPYHLQFEHSLNEQELTEMMRGIKLYQEHSYKPRKQKRHIMWQHDGSALYAAQSNADLLQQLDATPLILIPSLINSCDILDLCKSRSLMRWLTDRGIPTYLFDWGNLSKKDLQNIDIENIIEEKLVSAILEVSKMWGKSIDCLGYCMGGTLLLGAHNSVKDHIRRMVLLAAPWNFHDPKMGLTDHVAVWAPAALPVIQEKGYLPASWIQSLFATLDADGSARKFIRFAMMEQESKAAHLFLLVEDWLNEGADLPAALARHCIQEWFIRNAPYNEDWRIGINKVDVHSIRSPMLIVASERDRLVPYSAAENLRAHVEGGKVDSLKLKCGHIGFIAGKNSIADVWEPILDWLQTD